MSGGGNAFDPEGDDLAYAQAERRLDTLRGGRPDEAKMRRSLGTYRNGILSQNRRLANDGPDRIPTNMTKLDAAVRKAAGLCKNSAERAVLFSFVTGQATALRSSI